MGHLTKLNNITKQKAIEFAAWLKKDSSDETTKESAKGWYNSFAELLDTFASSNVNENSNGNKEAVPPTGEAPKAVDNSDGTNS